MDAPWVVAIVSGSAVILGALITAFVGPIIYPWYGERMSKSQLRVQRRMQVRQMIESELSKGLHDVASIGGYLSVMAAMPVAKAQETFAKMIMDNELKFGTWLSYTIQHTEVRQMCEDYRDIIRNLRVAIAQPPIPNAQALLSKARQDSDQKASEIVAKMDELGW